MRHGVTLCIEPNPREYDSDFVTNARVRVDLVARVDHPGFRLQFDAPGMTMAGDPLAATLRHPRVGGWTSVEMRFNPQADLETELRRVVAPLQDRYSRD